MNHLDAKVLVDALGLSQAESLYLRLVAWSESNYGGGWTGDGADSHNWGAITGIGPAGWFEHTDTDAAGKPYTAKFKRYYSDLEGAEDLKSVLLKPNVRAALPDLPAAVHAQIDLNHYTGSPPATPAYLYLSRLSQVMKEIVGVTGEPPLVAPGELDLPSWALASLLTSRTVYSGLATLKRGSRGADVAFVQFVLKTNGALDGHKNHHDIKVDGEFGPLTEAAVREFQSPRFSQSDGIIGPLTWKALAKVIQYGS